MAFPCISARPFDKKGCSGGIGLVSIPLFRILVTSLFAAFFLSCESLQPEVVIVNKTSEHILIKNPSFNGCIWNTVLYYGQSTSPQRCLDGSGKVHFQKFDAFEYCRDQQKDGTIDSLCPCDSTHPQIDSGLINPTPFWFNYQTLSTWDPADGDFLVIELTQDDMEQDFSVPGPYGH